MIILLWIFIGLVGLMFCAVAYGAVVYFFEYALAHSDSEE